MLNQMQTKRVAIYARYSSDMQSAASIEDQIRICKEYAEQNGWQLVNCYTDAEISGASMLLRPGIQALMELVARREVDVVLAEAMDRLSRDQEDIAGIRKRIVFAGAEFITLAEGEVTAMHIGFKGTMNAMQLEDLANKTRRGLRGKIENGQSGGGISYGYIAHHTVASNGHIIRGDREICEEQAAIVRRIFHEYAYKNTSPRNIAAQLNAEGIPSPSGKTWAASTINGNRQRGTGIINNDLYRGQLVWNRQRFVKDPATGKRVPRFNPESEWVVHDVPELRIVEQDVWDAVKLRQGKLDKRTYKKRRPQYLLSGLLKCGECGGGFTKLNSTQYGCATTRNKGEAICKNRKTIKREVLENAVLEALQTHLMRDDAVQLFCEEYTRQSNKVRAAQLAEQGRYKAESAKLDKDKASLIQALKDGIPASAVKDELQRVCDRQEELQAIMKAQKDAIKPIIHPAMAQRYRQAIQALRAALKQEQEPGEVREQVRGLIDKIVLTPCDDAKYGLKLDLYGNLAGILALAASDGKGDKSIQYIKMVAGARNHLVLLFSALNRSVLRKAVC